MTTIGTQARQDQFVQSQSALRRRADSLQAAISSGERLTRSSDDPVAASRLRMLGRAEASAQIDLAIAARTSANLMLTDSALQSFADSAIRVKQLQVQAANETMTADQRRGIATEMDQIFHEMVRLANTRDSSGHALFGGEAVGDAYALDALGGALYIGSPSASEQPLGDGQSVTRGLTGPEFLDYTVAGSPANLLQVVRNLADALAGGTDPAQAARDSMDAVDAGLELITTRQTIVGARLNWIELNVDRRTHMSELRAEEQAEIGGTDLAEALSKLQQTMTVLEASQASFARLSALNLFEVLR